MDNLKMILVPILPHTAQRLHEYLGYDGRLFGTQKVEEYQKESRSHEALSYDYSGAIGTWTPSQLPPGQALREPTPMFKKLDESVVEEEYTRLGGQQTVHSERAGAHAPALCISCGEECHAPAVSFPHTSRWRTKDPCALPIGRSKDSGHSQFQALLHGDLPGWKQFSTESLGLFQ
jgi:hypothetical protein